MLLRLIIFAAMVSFGFAVYRALKVGRQLEGGTARALLEARTDSELVEAKALASKIGDVIEKHAGVGSLEEGEKIRSQVGSMLEQLALQLDVRERISKAIDDDASARLERELDEARASEHEAASKTVEHLELQFEQLRRLEEKQESLSHTTKQIVLELKTLHLALLDAISSKAEIGTPALVEARMKLERASEALTQQAAADEEVTKLLASARKQTVSG